MNQTIKAPRLWWVIVDSLRRRNGPCHDSSMAFTHPGDSEQRLKQASGTIGMRAEVVVRDFG